MAAPQQKVFTAEQVAKYRQVFNMFDINKNGVIESGELEAVSQLLSTLKLRGGSMTFQQFLECMPGYTTMGQATQQPVYVAPIQPQSVQVAHHAPQQTQPIYAAGSREQQLMEMFRRFDKDNNGFISLEEAHQVLAHVLGTTWDKSKELVKQFDVNNDGRLSYNEFITFYSKIEQRRAEIDAAFHQFDRGNKGYITIEDAKTIMNRFGLSGPEIESLVLFHDANRDGKLQYTEFKQFWSARGGLMGQGFSFAPPTQAPAPVASYPQGGTAFPVSQRPSAPVGNQSVRHQQIQNAFSKFDRDGNGYISLQEAQQVMAQELGFTADRTSSMVRQFDINNDGRLSYNEFVNFFVKVEEQKNKIDEAFRRFDKAGKGYVTSHDAKSIMRDYGFSDYEIDGLIRLHDRNQDGKLQYHEFIQFWTGGSGGLSQMATPSVHVAAQRPVQQVQQAQSVGISGSSRHQQIQQAFKAFDRDGNGFITLAEAEIVLAQQLGFSGAKTREMVKEFDINNDGRLSYNEFVAFYSKFEERKIAIDQAFHQFDRGNKGFVTVDDAKNIMRNFMFNDTEIERLVRMHDTNNDGKLQYNEFIRFWNV